MVNCQNSLELESLIASFSDINAPKHVQIQVSNDKKRVWVNVNGICVLRASNIEQLSIDGVSLPNIDDKPYVVLRAIDNGNVFYSSTLKGEDPTRLANGIVAYTVIAYCDSIEEAQQAIVSELSSTTRD